MKTNMRKIWQQKINEIDEIILETPISSTLTLMGLFRKRSLLETAMNNCVVL